MKKLIVTMMMVMALATAAVSAQNTKTVDKTAAVQIQTVKDALVEKAWAAIDDYQQYFFENKDTLTNEEVERLEEDLLKRLPKLVNKCVNKENIKVISKAELKKALND